MTRQEFHEYFKVAVDKNAKGIAFGGAPAFLPEEIDYWINLALYQVILKKYNGEDTQQVKYPAFEQSVKRIHDLEGLVKTDINQSTTANTDLGAMNSVFVDNVTGKVNDRMLFVSARLKWQSKKETATNDTNKDSVAIIRLIDHNAVEHYRQTYNNTPWIEEPVGIFEENKLTIFYDPITMVQQDGATGYKVDITYLAYPTELTSDLTTDITELPVHVYHEVINKAALLALEDIESQRIQSKAQLNATAE